MFARFSASLSWRRWKKCRLAPVKAGVRRSNMLRKAQPGDPATPDQEKTLRAILELTDELGYPPAVEQIRVRLGLRSVSSVHRSLSYLRVKGYVDWNAGQARTLRVL